MNTTELFLIALVAIFSLPYLAWRLGRTEYFAPLVVIQIITGIMLGPGVLGAVFPNWYSFVFNPQVITALNGIAWWAVSLFVFFAGIELDLRRLNQNKVETSITAGLALGVPLITGSIAALVLLQFPGWIGEQAQTWQFLLGIGMASAVTALPILILLMQKLGIYRQPLGQRILGYASLDDIAIWGVLALLLMDWNRLGHQGMFLCAYVLAAVLFRKLMSQLTESDRLYVSFIWLAMVACAADWAGLHFMVGAFLAGMIIDRDWFKTETLDQLRDNVLLVMMPVFFLSTGLRTDWQMGGFAVVGATMLMFVAQLTGKLGGIYAAGKLLGWQTGEAKIIGYLLQTKALIEIIFVNVLLDKGIITNQMFTVMLLMAVASTMITIPVVSPLLKKYQNIQ